MRRRLQLFTGLLTAMFYPCLLFPAPPPLSPLGKAPDWSRLDAFQETIRATQFEKLLSENYAPRGGWQTWLSIIPEGNCVLIRKNAGPPEDLYSLHFAANEAPVRPPPRYWHPRSSLPPCPPDRPLAGLKIVLDPGHLGGTWARMEERWFKIGNAAPVTEGDMNLEVAKLSAIRLRVLGAEVTLVRENAEPLTNLRPADFLDAARQMLEARGVREFLPAYSGPGDPHREQSIQWASEVLFSHAEIRARAGRINETIKPDLAVCLHFNAEAWGDPAKPALVDKNHFHVLINGCYSPDEIARNDTRFEMLVKLLNGSHAEELGLAQAAAPVLASATGLPPYVYTGPNAFQEGPGIWARNLLANRLYQCPVLYMEPYVMNSPEVFARIQAGDYDGRRAINGVDRPSIYREYADAVAGGLADYYRNR